MWILWKSQAVTKGKVFESCTLMEILQYTQSRKIIKSHHDSKFNLVLPQSIRQVYHAFSYLSMCDIRNNSRKATVWLFIWRINKHLNMSFFSLIFLTCLFVCLFGLKCTQKPEMKRKKIHVTLFHWKFSLPKIAEIKMSKRQKSSYKHPSCHRFFVFFFSPFEAVNSWKNCFVKLKQMLKKKKWIPNIWKT